MKFRVTEKGPTPRRLRKHIKQANLAAALTLGRHFHSVNLPRRFTVSGGIMLGYAVRSPRYRKLKLKSKGHNNPNVWSGFTRDQVLRTEDIRTRGTSKRWTVNVVLRARHLNRFKSGDINVAEEISRVAPKEEAPLARVFERAFGQELNRIT